MTADNMSDNDNFVRYTAEEMNEEIDRMRKENGWKPRRRGKSQVKQLKIQNGRRLQWISLYWVLNIPCSVDWGFTNRKMVFWINGIPIEIFYKKTKRNC